ncbi:MAG TPA: hypothetical protein VLG15_08450 [Thermoanaerobaculia bacterium]|nr:hypothetical protein [Thermoanaerobaculia bacterium]
MQIMSPHLATDRRASAWRQGDPVATAGASGASERQDGTAASFRRACLVIAAWLLALLLFPILFYYQP